MGMWCRLSFIRMGGWKSGLRGIGVEKSGDGRWVVRVSGIFRRNQERAERLAWSSGLSGVFRKGRILLGFAGM